MTIQENVSEAQFQRQVIDIAKTYGWRVAHFRPGQTAKGAWVTPVAADGAGFPDLCMVHEKRQEVVFAELKTDTGRLSDKQREWLDALEAAAIYSPNMRVCIWRPADFDQIVGILSGAGERQAA